MHKRLIIPVNEQGKVGKTFLFSSLIDWYKQQPGLKWAAFDPDTDSPRVSDFHPEAKPIDLTDTRELDALVRGFNEADVIVADGRGGHYVSAFAAWMREVRLLSICERVQARVTYLFITDGTVKNIEQAKSVIEGVIERKEDVDLVLVVNAYNLPSGHPPSLWLGSKTRTMWLSRNALEITMPKLHPLNMQYLESYRHTPGHLRREGLGMGLDFCDHGRFTDFSEVLEGEFAMAADFLLPAASSKSAKKKKPVADQAVA